MTTCTFQLVGLPRGRIQVFGIRHSGPPTDADRFSIHFPSFAAGLSEISAFNRWARDSSLEVKQPDHVTYAVACKRKDLVAFWKQNYAPAILRAANDLASGERILREMNEATIREAIVLLKALEQLNSRKLYALIAYEH